MDQELTWDTVVNYILANIRLETLSLGEPTDIWRTAEQLREGRGAIRYKLVADERAAMVAELSKRFVIATR